MPLAIRFLPGLLLVLVGFAVWTAFSVLPGLMQSSAPFRIREAWDTALFWRLGVPLMLLAQAVGGAVARNGIIWQPLWMLGGLFAGVVAVHPGGGDFGMLPLAVILIGVPSYLGLLAAAAVGRAAGKFLGD
ncbi:hypothetical protein FFI89_028480 [Bradyrhizobium sp. KBS0727]|jgi:hypothetical protein|uniref:hypothetical protein n=1 Tax=unclassified Bradyrhizobium TaxID=2631580 RepID=UPI00110E6CEE|nr:MULTISPECIES: hypothetical protein [unclassified Bradyrhizobium]QDW40716.1 hypothetical protein FFI71_028485 [Bradyrhizobium sp. KBS0725]QDW47322.1 hypothetical protein FFI89_028480 [Bradyrhizobium sp. KBS0727]